MAGFVQALSKAPRAQVIGGSIGAAMALAGIFHGIMLAQGQRTLAHITVSYISMR